MSSESLTLNCEHMICVHITSKKTQQPLMVTAFITDKEGHSLSFASYRRSPNSKPIALPESFHDCIARGERVEGDIGKGIRVATLATTLHLLNKNIGIGNARSIEIYAYDRKVTVDLSNSIDEAWSNEMLKTLLFDNFYASYFGALQQLGQSVPCYLGNNQVSLIASQCNINTVYSDNQFVQDVEVGSVTF